MPSKQPDFHGGGRAVGHSETDPKTVKDQYAISNFYIASKDRYHDSEKIRVPTMKGTQKTEAIRVPPYMWARINMWVADPQTPYRSANDYWRDSGYHRDIQLTELANQEDNPQWLAFRYQAEIERRADEAARHIETISGVKNVIAEASANGDWTLLQDTLKQASLLADVIPSPYREQLHDVVEAQLRLDRVPNRRAE
jgi:hypothetical protein